jgi:hypothetical protein
MIEIKKAPKKDSEDLMKMRLEMFWQCSGNVGQCLGNVRQCLL